ncbi:hypothetical protein OTB20_18860 [Streptomyces sp. H27-H1]|uniref:hypothetical protein n=1 Tax=Streptomyces sp. H27-H1 TaxID=2996461 RepID=UPI00226DE0C2|nr:hypothetical protein [Streptomyces sp. H27-H1]MCY0928219.1 hypothetical protein [Streptomyces sp. H27-H1]
MSDADWADYLQAANDDARIQDELADREAQVENGLISHYDEYGFSWEPSDGLAWTDEVMTLAAAFEQIPQRLVLLDSAGNVPDGPWHRSCTSRCTRPKRSPVQLAIYSTSPRSPSDVLTPAVWPRSPTSPLQRRWPQRPSAAWLKPSIRRAPLPGLPGSTSSGAW